MGHRSGQKIYVKAAPEPIGIVFPNTGIIAVDMQNAFLSKGGYFDLLRYDMTDARRIIEPCRAIISGGRSRGIKIIYLKMLLRMHLGDTGCGEIPWYHKSKAMALLTERPGLRDKLYIDNTWGSEIIAELKPRQEDIIVKKHRYDGFVGTGLDRILEALGIKYLIFIGIATNVCVESTLRHAFSLDYFPIIVSDAVTQKGPRTTQESTLLNVESNFGWVTTARDVLKAMGDP